MIAEAISSYSKSKVHIFVNNNSNNTPSSNVSLSDSRLSVDRDGLVTIPGSLVVNSTNIMTAITALQNNSGSSIDGTIASHVSSLKATGSISSSSAAEQVEIGKSGS